jgi:hypothetical protein
VVRDLHAVLRHEVVPERSEDEAVHATDSTIGVTAVSEGGLGPRVNGADRQRNEPLLALRLRARGDAALAGAAARRVRVQAARRVR